MGLTFHLLCLLIAFSQTTPVISLINKDLPLGKSFKAFSSPCFSTRISISYSKVTHLSSKHRFLFKASATWSQLKGYVKSADTCELHWNYNLFIFFSQEFDVEYLIRQLWKANSSACTEYYLQHLEEAPHSLSPGNVRHITISGADVKGFWTPSTYVPEARRIELDSSAVRNNVLEILASQSGCVFKYRAR